MTRSGPFREAIVFSLPDEAGIRTSVFYPSGEWANPYDHGLAHYVEHLAWQNMRDAGADSGHHSNAWTSPASTAYYLDRDADDLPNMVARLAASAAPLEMSEDIAIKERDIVLREYDLRRGEDLVAPHWSNMRADIYGDTQWARWTMGDRASIQGFTLENARLLHDRSHQLASATLLVSGPIQESAVQAAVDALTGDYEPRAEPLPLPQPFKPQSVETTVRKSTIRGLGAPRHLLLKAVPTPPGLSAAKLDVSAEILVDLLLSTKEGGLAGPLRYNSFLANRFDLGIEAVGPSVRELWFTAVPDADVSLPALNDGVIAALNTALTAPLQSSFQDIRDRMLARYDGILDPAKANYDAYDHAVADGRDFVPLAELRSTAAHMTFPEFSRFLAHFGAPAPTSIRLLSAI